MRSIKNTLLLATTASTAVLMVTAGLLLFVTIRDRLIEGFESTLYHKFYLLEALGEFRDMLDESIDPEARKESTEIVEEFVNVRQDIHYATRTFMQIWDEAGEERYRSPTLGDFALETHHGPLLSDMATRWVELPDGRPGRARDEHILLVPQPLGKANAPFGFEYPDEPAAQANAVRVTIALDATDLLADIAFLKNALLGVGALALAMQCIVLWRFIQVSLRPVVGLANQIESLDERALTERLPTELPGELIPIAERLNGFLQRLQAAFAREKEFTDDVAHELRTPLTVLQLKFDLALSEDRSADTLREMLAECRIVGGQLQDMVNSLLTLSRIESGQIDLEWQTVPLNDVLERTWVSIVAHSERDLLVDWDLQENCRITTDLRLFEHAATNLLDNAATYTNDGGRIAIRTVWESGSVVFSVTNTGSTLTQCQAEQALDRFWRLDAARQDDGSHSGLGLSLVVKIVEVLGGQLKVQSTSGAEFSISITLPCDYPMLADSTV